ncbi:MAG: hypothetical protein K2H51_02600, partial [Malacoplasma sp.]|nr:hypothetical protein [Malacoplasma sp.]
MLSSSVLAACSICSLASLNNNNNNNSNLTYNYITKNADSSSTTTTIDFNSDQKWIDDIKEAATATKNDGNIQIFFTRNASLLYQQSLVSLLYLLDNTSTSSSDTTDTDNSGNEIKQIAYFVDDAVYQAKNRFNFDTIKNNEKTLFVSKTSDIPTNSDETQTPTDDIPYSTVPTSNQIDLTYNYYKSALESGKKIDIWAADLTVNSLFSGSDAKNGFVKLLPYINKIYILSDGNAQTANFIDAYVKRRKEHYISDEEAKNIWSQLQDTNKSEEERLDILSNSTLYDFLRLEEYMNIFHILEYTQSPYWNLSADEIYRAYAFNIDYYKMSNSLYEESQETEKQNYLTNYEKFFLLSDTNLQSFVESGFDNYDPNKKNIVWMGDNLWTENNDYTRISTNNNMIKEVQNFFLILTKKYPANEYN